LHQALIRCPCGVIDLVDSGTVPGLRYKFHSWLKEVDVQSSQIIYSPQTFKRGFRGIPVVSHKAAYHIAILLLNMTAIILFVGTRPGEDDLLILTIVIETVVNELPAVIRVYAKKREGEMLSHPVYRLPYLLLPFTPYRQAFCPAAGNVYGTERVQVKTLRALTAVSYQVCLYKTRLVLFPIGKCFDGYTPLQQTSWAGSGK
jgi:hypothetical protein